MFKWSSFPFIRLSIALILGILSSQLLPEDFLPLFVLYGAVVIFSIIALFTSRLPILRGASLIIVFVTIGYLLGYLQVASRASDHYTHQGDTDGFVGVIVSDHSERTNHRRYEVNLIETLVSDSVRKVKGKIYLYVERNEDEVFAYGDVVTVSKGYFEISPPKNPNEFDYRKYLSRQNIYAHAFVSPDEIEKVDHLTLNPVLSWAYHIRSESQYVIDEFIKSPRERAIVSALILGIKDHLDNELKTAYSSAGAIHVLAVSGLHVGIIFLLLNILFKPWKRNRYGRYVFMVVAVTVIWMYALVTGFSPSVMRAATMFTVIIVSESFNQKANVYNSLGIAAFLLIILDPFVIYSVGFQLSFIAVFGILMVYPLLYHKVHIHNRIGDYVWSILCVSIAAQLATFPLTLYYFHQFPTYFLVSNLIVIPAATVMLYGGLLVLVLGATLPVAAEVVAFIYELIVKGVNEVVLSLKVLPYPLFDWIYFDVVDVVLIYLILLAIYQLFTQYNYQLVKVAVYGIALFSCWLVWKDWKREYSDLVVFYEVDDVAAIDIIHGKSSVLLVDTFPNTLREETYYQIDPFRLASGLSKVSESWEQMNESSLVRRVGMVRVIDAGELQITMVGDLNGYELAERLTTDIVYVTAPCDKLLEWFDCELVVIGNGLDYFEKKKMISMCEQHQQKYHSLKDDGYLALTLNELAFPLFPNNSAISSR